MSNAEINKLQDTIKNLEKELKNNKLEYNNLLSQKENVSVLHRRSMDALTKNLKEKKV